MNPTLRMDDGGAAGAGAGDPDAKKRQKTGTATDNYKVSNNFPRRYPVRAANNEPGHTSPSVLVPSDDDELADGDKKPAAKRTSKKADNDVEEAEKEASKPAAKGGSTGAYDSDDDVPDALQYGMQALLDKAEIPGTVASFCMEVATRMYGDDDDSAGANTAKFGGIVASLRDEETALMMALSPETRGQPYLTRIGGNAHFSVLYGLQRWPQTSSVTDGLVVAFEGEIDNEGIPAMFRLEEDEGSLFRLTGLEDIEPGLISAFYHAKNAKGEFHRDDKFFDYATASEEGIWVPRMTPIPAMWAPMFLDKPDMGTTCRRIEDLIRGTDASHRTIFEPVLAGVAYSCLQDGSVQESYLGTEWKRIPRSKHNREVITDLWAKAQSNQNAEAEDDVDVLGTIPPRDDIETHRKNPPKRPEPDLSFASLFADGRKRKAIPIPSRTGAPPGQTTAKVGRRAPPTPPPPRRTARTPGPAAVSEVLPHPGLGAAAGIDLATIITAIIQGQNENQLAIAAASNASMMAYHTATAQSLAAKSGDKDSKLTTMKKRILQACSGHGDTPQFAPAQVYVDMEIEGSTSEAVGRILRSLLQPRTRSINKPNVFVTPQLMQTVKSMNFSANGDKTYAGCTKGITIFATPWRSIEAMNEDALEDACFEASTHKSVADVRKHIAGIKVELPSDLMMLIRMFNNYIKLLEVLFGTTCPHLVHVSALRDGLEENESDLESRMTKTLCLHLLWRVHQDARNFFMACERWEPSEPIPTSSLSGTVRRLTDDCCIDVAMTCPAAAFLGADPSKPKAKTAGDARPAKGRQPTVNPSIPPGCKKAVDAFNALYPTMPLSVMIKKGNITLREVTVGGKGDCSSFGLLGRCTATCPYNHVVCTVPVNREATISAAITKATATITRGMAAS